MPGGKPVSHQIRVALATQGDPSQPGAWSGVPAGLAAGLRTASCEVIPIDAGFPGAAIVARRLRMSWANRSASRVFAAACSHGANRALRAAAPLDGVVMIGSGYELSTGVPFITLEDMTLAQALRTADPVYGSLSSASVARWMARQRRIYEASRGCCVASNWAAESIREDYGISGAKIHVVGLGHNVAVEPHKRDWSVPRFLFVGFDWERKRGAAVVDAFSAVRSARPQATLDLVGRHPPIEQTGVIGHGELPLGSEEARAHYMHLLGKATCFLMPSTYEPFGIAYLDAAAAGVPSIGTTVGGAADAIGPGGLLVDPNDPSALRDAMLELSDPVTAMELGRRAQDRSRLLAWPAVAERVLRAIGPAGLKLDGLATFLDSLTPESA